MMSLFRFRFVPKYNQFGWKELRAYIQADLDKIAGNLGDSKQADSGDSQKRSKAAGSQPGERANKRARIKHEADPEPLASIPDRHAAFAVPELEDIGFDAAAHSTPFKGGETVALARMKAYLSDAKRVLTFEKPKTAPTALEPETTVLR